MMDERTPVDAPEAPDAEPPRVRWRRVRWSRVRLRPPGTLRRGPRVALAEVNLERLAELVAAKIPRLSSAELHELAEVVTQRLARESVGVQFQQRQLRLTVEELADVLVKRLGDWCFSRKGIASWI